MVNPHFSSASTDVALVIATKCLQVAFLGPLLTYTRTCRLIKNNWTEKEVITATGTASGTIAEHPLKLKSSYASVKVAEVNVSLTHVIPGNEVIFLYIILTILRFRDQHGQGIRTVNLWLLLFTQNS